MQNSRIADLATATVAVGGTLAIGAASIATASFEPVTWPSVSEAAANTAGLVAPLAALLGARLSGRERSWRSVRTAVAIAVAITVILDALWLGIGTAHAAEGLLGLGWWVATAAAIVCSAAIGCFFGSRTGSGWLLALLFAGCIYALFIPIAGSLRGELQWLSQLYVITQNRTDYFYGYNAGTLLGQTVWFAAVACLAVMWSGPRRSTPGGERTGERLLFVSIGSLAAIAAVAGAALVYAGHGVIVEGYNPPRYECQTSSSTRVCLAGPYRDSLAETSRVVEKYNDSVPGLQIDSVYQTYVGSSERSASGSWPIGLPGTRDDQTRQGISKLVVLRIQEGCPGLSPSETQEFVRLLFSDAIPHLRCL